MSIVQPLIGQVLMERYLVLEHLAVGGFSQTYLAVDTEDPQATCLVLKLLDTQRHRGLSFDCLNYFFEAEAHALGRLGAAAQRQNYSLVPQLFAYCRDQLQVYLVQEFIDGERLDVAFKAQPPQFKVLLETLLEILMILDRVHHEGIIHGDIKPSNLIRRSADGKADGELILIDFGACRLPDQVTLDQVTSSCSFDMVSDFMLGTPGYMPPEQAEGLLDFSSDLYALGIMMIQFLTGVEPKQLEKYPETQTWAWHHHIRKPVQWLPLIPILDRMVRVDHTDRFQSAMEVIEALKPIAPKLILPTFRRISDAVQSTSS
jgi:serine/threonine protein kinase